MAQKDLGLRLTHQQLLHIGTRQTGTETWNKQKESYFLYGTVDTLRKEVPTLGLLQEDQTDILFLNEHFVIPLNNWDFVMTRDDWGV